MQRRGRGWEGQGEQEMSVRLCPRGSKQSIECNVDGLVRGDFKTPMAAHVTTIQDAIRTPNEVRTMENMSALPGGDDLMIQGATVPISNQGGGTDADTE